MHEQERLELAREKEQWRSAQGGQWMQFWNRTKRWMKCARGTYCPASWLTSTIAERGVQRCWYALRLNTRANVLAWVSWHGGVRSNVARSTAAQGSDWAARRQTHHQPVGETMTRQARELWARRWWQCGWLDWLGRGWMAGKLRLTKSQTCEHRPYYWRSCRDRNWRWVRELPVSSASAAECQYEFEHSLVATSPRNPSLSLRVAAAAVAERARANRSWSQSQRAWIDQRVPQLL